MLGDNTFAPSTVEKINNQYVGKVNFGDDSKIYAVFAEKAFLNDFKTKANGGVNVYEPKLMVTLYFVGDKSKVVFQEAKEPDKRRFAEAWAAYQAGMQPVPTGTQLKLVNWVTETQLLNLMANHVHTVEQLADLSDISVQNIGLGGMELRKKANIALESQRSAEPLIKERARAEALQVELDAIKAKSAKDFEDLKSLIGQVKAAPAKKKGRPFQKKVKEQPVDEVPFAPATTE